MGDKSIRKQLFFWAALVVAGLVSVGPVCAMSFEMGSGTTIDADVTLGFGTAYRLKDQDPGKLTLANINADDGNRNFDKGDFPNNRFSIIADIDVKHDDFGLFVRPRAFYDFAYTGDNSNDSPRTNNNLIAGSISRTDEFDDETVRAHGRKAEVLDAFVYGGFDLGGRNLQLRAGRQVVQWGESLFLQGGISSAMAHLDATAANAPGVEVKEIFLPSGSVFAQIDLTNTISAGAYYQYEWKKTRLNESGSYFSDKDFLDEAGHAIITPLGVLRRGADDEPDDQGQYGISMMYRAGWLAETEFGLYYINYHEKTPIVNTNFSTGTYSLSFAEDVKLYGFSFSSLLGSTNISGEFSYRHDYPVVTTTGTQRTDFIQGQVSWLYSLAGIPKVDRISFNGEVGANRVMGIEDKNLGLDKDKFAWGYSATLAPQWYQVLPDLDLSLPITYKGHPDGNSVNSSTFTEKNDSGSIGLEFIYKNNYKATIKYVEFFHSDDNPFSDRDYIALDIKYTF